MKKVLVGLDASPRSSVVLDEAIGLVQQTGGQLILLHAYNLPVGLPIEVYAMAPDALPTVLEQNAKRALEDYAARVPEGRLLKKHVALGTPWQQICEMAKQEDVDLIVIGSHGYGGLDRLLGTTAARVVNHADRSVLVVHKPEWDKHEKHKK
jgi:universal stress protein F